MQSSRERLTPRERFIPRQATVVESEVAAAVTTPCRCRMRRNTSCVMRRTTRTARNVNCATGTEQCRATTSPMDNAANAQRKAPMSESAFVICASITNTFSRAFGTIINTIPAAQHPPATSPTKLSALRLDEEGGSGEVKFTISSFAEM